MSPTEQTAVMLLAHGTREVEASKPVHHYAKELSELTGLRVEPCMREFIEPSVPTVTQKLVDAGYTSIAVVPFFLFRSGHVTRDITADLAKEKEKHPNLKFVVGEPLGIDPSITQLLKKRLEEALDS